MFSDPNLLGKLATNPRTQKHLADPAFVQKVMFFTCYQFQNPYLILKYLLASSDPEEPSLG